EDVRAEDPGAENALCGRPERARHPPMPSPRPGQDRAESWLLTGAAVELQIVHSPAATPIDIDQLLVEESVDQVHPVAGHQTEPPSVTSSSGIAATETTKMITKYS